MRTCIGSSAPNSSHTNNLHVRQGEIPTMKSTARATLALLFICSAGTASAQDKEAASVLSIGALDQLFSRFESISVYYGRHFNRPSAGAATNGGLQWES